MISKRERWTVGVLISLVIVVITLPYYFAWKAGGDTHVFHGFLLNLFDGHSYMGKMRQGWMGSWTFTLPFTAQPGEGTYLFSFYLLLGHIARILGWSILFTFHFFRAAAAVVLYWMLFHLTVRVFPASRPRWTAYLLAGFGAGLGWAAIPWGSITSDFWVAEAYVFHSAYSNVHFPLGLALQIWLILPGKDLLNSRIAAAKVLLAAFVLAVISPFGAMVVLVVWGGVFAWQFILKEWRAAAANLLYITLGSLPVLVYYAWVSRTHPVLAGWSAQNLTPTPDPLDFLISFSPALLLAIPGSVYALRKKDLMLRTIVVWAVLSMVFLYIPFSLQRRFLTGISVPIVILCVVALETWIEKWPRIKVWLLTGVYLLALPTTLILLLSSGAAVSSLDDQIYSEKSEVEAFEWMQQNLPERSLVLASSTSGLYIPGYSGLRVLYGHPFETVNAEERMLAVDSFYSGELPVQAGLSFLKENQINYVFLGPRERALGEIPWIESLDLVYELDGVKIYSFWIIPEEHSGD